MQNILDEYIQYVYNQFTTPTIHLDQYGRVWICPCNGDGVEHRSQNMDENRGLSVHFGDV